VLGRFFSFEGRIGRGTFWVVQLFIVAVLWVYIEHVDPLLAHWLPYSVFEGLTIALIAATPIIWLQCLITIKRCHDRGKSGFWSLLLLVPVIGWCWLLIDCGLLPPRVR
jgi:uncharacterized membrane protein YhaH (DUF805 family)